MGSTNEKMKEIQSKLQAVNKLFDEAKEAMNNREKQIKQQLDKKMEVLSAKNIENQEEYARELEKLKQFNNKKLERLEEQREEDRIKHENDIKEWQEKTMEITKRMEQDNLKTSTIHCVHLIHSNIKLYREKKEKCVDAFNKYKDQLREIKQEQHRLHTFFVEENKDKTLLNIVLIGITGHGKSTFGSRLLGDKSNECNGKTSFLEQFLGNSKQDHFKHNDNVNSETQNITKKIVRKVWKKDLSVIDTPGIFDSGGKDINHANSLVKFLRGCGGVNAFLLVKTRHPPRIDMSFKDSLKTLEDLLGSGFWKHVVMIITHTRGKDAQKVKFKTYSQRFRETILNDMNLNAGEAPLPFIGVDSFEHYKEPIKELIKIIPTKRFLCDELRSPLDELKLKNVNISKKFKNMKTELDELKKVIHIYKDELNVASVRLQEMNKDFVPKSVDLSELNENKDEWEISIEETDDSNVGMSEIVDTLDHFETKEDIMDNENIDWILVSEEENVYNGTLDTDDDITIRLTDLAFTNPWTIKLNEDSDEYNMWVEKFKELTEQGDDIEVTVKSVVYKNKDKQTQTKTEYIVKNVVKATDFQ